jgi:kexin
MDNSNYDGQTNYRGVMAVAAVDDQGKQSSYSESGANLWISSPGGEFCSSTHAITTTDRTGDVGDNTALTAGTSDYANQNYTKCMNGTSAATPGVAGVAALVLAANPNLGWRDVRIILAQSARKNDPIDIGWQTNHAGYHFNHKYGFGVVDADAAVSAAKSYGTNVGPQVISTLYSSTFKTALQIPDGSTTGVSDTIAVANSGINSIEWVEITFSATHPMTGDLDVFLTNLTTGMVSQLAEHHSCAGTSPQYSCSSTYFGWVFGSAAHLGEAADGVWKLTVKDYYTNDAGTFDSWKLQFYGH